MKTKAPKIGTTYKVTCPDFEKSGLASREDAERWVESVEKFGHCHQTHVIGTASDD